MPTIEVTTKIGCSVACKYCPQKTLIDNYDSNIRTLKFDTFERCLRTVPTGIPIHFSGMSEPWLAPETTRMVEHALQKGHSVRIHTTLTGMTIADVENLAQHEYIRFEVHLPDGDHLMKRPVTKQYLEVLQAILSSGISTLAFRVLGSNQLHPDIEEALFEGTDLQIGKGVHSRGGLLLLEEIEKPLKFGFRWGLKGHPLKCKRKMQQIVLLPNGDVTACCHDYGLALRFGNLLEVDYSSLFSLDKYVELQRMLKGGQGHKLPCSDCIDACIRKR